MQDLEQASYNTSLKYFNSIALNEQLAVILNLYIGSKSNYVCASVQKPPRNIQLVANTLAILWQDGAEDYIEAAFLRAYSPSAENSGEVDILGVRHGGGTEGDLKRFENVKILAWETVGNYALRFIFSDGHNTGIYTYKYLHELGAAQQP